jgi:hypothetical protein
VKCFPGCLKKFFGSLGKKNASARSFWADYIGLNLKISAQIFWEIDKS